MQPIHYFLGAFVELGGGAPKTPRLNEKLAEIRLLHFATFQTYVI